MSLVPPSPPPFVSFGQRLARRLMLCGVVVLLLLTPMAYWIVQYTFDDLESSYATEKLHFIEKFLVSEERALRINSFDYGNWQASYNAVKGKNPQFYKKDLRRDDLINFNVQAMGLFDTSGQLKSWAPQLSRSENFLRSIEPIIASLVQEHSKSLPEVAPLDSLGPKERNPYFVWTKAAWVDAKPYPLMVALAPILSYGPAQDHGGWVVFVRIMDPDYIASLYEQTGIPFTVNRIEDEAKDETVAIAGPSIVGTQRLSEHPQFSIRIQLEPRWEHQRLRMFGTIFMAAFILLFFLMLFGYILMESTVLKRLHDLTDKVRDIHMPTGLNDAPAPLAVQQKYTDEIDVLTMAINTMFGHVASANQKLSHESRHDALTGLANRRDLMLTLAELKERMQSGTLVSFGLMLMDLNGFKPINDTIGHAAGDVMLQKLAERFRAMATPNLRFFRLGGDEFAVVLLNASQDSVQEALPSLHEAVRGPAYYDGHVLRVDAAIGVTLASLNTPWSPDSLLRAADVAMYANKRQKPNRP